MPVERADPMSPERVCAAAALASWRAQSRATEAPWLHGEIARRMAQRLDVIRLKPAAVAQWWGAADASREVLRAAYPRAATVRVEPTPAFAAARREGQAASRRWPWQRWQTGAVVTTGEDIAAGSVQLVWSNLAIHAAPDPVALFRQWHRALAPEGFVMYSAFGPDTLRELRTLYRRRRWGAPAQDYIDMHDLGDMLLEAGFADPVMDQETLTLTWPNAAAMLAELRSLGRNAAPARHAGLRTPRWRDELTAALVAGAGADGRLPLSVEIVYGHAFKAAPRMPVAAHSAISEQDLRTMLRHRAPRPPG